MMKIVVWSVYVIYVIYLIIDFEFETFDSAVFLIVVAVSDNNLSEFFGLDQHEVIEGRAR